MLPLGEPTANLDLDSVGRLASALVAYRKAFVVVSHDGRFRAGIGVRRRPRVTAGKPGDAGSVRAC